VLLVKSITTSQNTRKQYTLHLGEKPLQLGSTTSIMGIVNMTPDSFSLDGCSKNPKNSISEGLRHAKKLIRDGADILDIGGESSRPGADKISIKEEIERTIPLIKQLSKSITKPISIDTYKKSVAQKAMDCGATMVNYIMGTNADNNFLKMIKNYDAAIILMHASGTPKVMQKRTKYTNVVEEIVASLRKSIENCLEIGIKSDKIVVDPGIGFGKNLEHNLEILNRLGRFKTLNQPLLVGTSRKSFIGHILQKDVKKRLSGTLASVCASILHGTHIIRVHDVKSVKEVALVTDAIINETITSN